MFVGKYNLIIISAKTHRINLIPGNYSHMLYYKVLPNHFVKLNHHQMDLRLLKAVIGPVLPPLHFCLLLMSPFSLLIDSRRMDELQESRGIPVKQQ